MKNTRNRVSYAFTALSVNNLIGFTQVVIICLTNNAAFPNLTAKVAELTTLLKALQDAANAMALGGTPQHTVLRDEAQEALLDALRQTGAAVQSVALNSLSTLLSSGFQAVSQNTASTPLDTPTILSASNLATTQVLLRLTPIDNARSYEIRLTADGGKTWLNGGISSQARRIVLPNLVPGTVYTIQARAIGGSTGQSDWSTPVSIMAT